MSNYVALNGSTNAFDMFGFDESTLEYKPHITMMYSGYPEHDHVTVRNFVSNMPAYKMIKGTKLRVTGVELFENYNGGYSVVLLIDHSCLLYIHRMLLLMGMNHSYPEFKPHMSLTYNTPLAEAKEIKLIVELMIDKIWVIVEEVIAEPTN